jgi:hypothetical protein
MPFVDVTALLVEEDLRKYDKQDQQGKAAFSLSVHNFRHERTGVVSRKFRKLAV